MTRTYMACHKLDLDFVFKLTVIIESFYIWNFWKLHKMSALVSKIIIQNVNKAVEELPNIYQPD